MPALLARIATAAVFLATLFGVPAYSVWKGSWPFRGVELPGWAAARSGEAAKAVERALEESSPIVPAVRPAYNEFVFRALGMTTPQVALGRDGWMFLSGTVMGYPPRDAAADLPRTVGAAAEIIRWLEARGTRVVPLLVPNKATIVPEAVGAWMGFRPAYDDLLAAYRAAGVEVDDLRGDLRDGDRPLYYENDSHWTGDGALRVAERVARQIEAIYAGGPVGGREHATQLRRGEPREFEGGIQRLLGFREDGALWRSLRVEKVDVFGRDPDTGRVASHQTPEAIAVAGTSFSEGLRFASLLSALLQRRVEDRSFGGAGPALYLHVIVQEYLLGQRDALPEVLVWEYPERQAFLNREEIREPVENLLRAIAYSDGARGPLPGRRTDHDIRVLEPGGEDLVGAGIGGRGRVDVDFDEPLAGDGRHALVFRVTAPAMTEAWVYVDSGSGFGDGPARVVRVFGRDEPQLVVVPLEAPAEAAAGAAIRRLRLKPVLGPRKFELSPLELWTRDG